MCFPGFPLIKIVFHLSLNCGMKDDPLLSLECGFEFTLTIMCDFNLSL